jgi:osmoprotectant transport system ATP-binding protein
MIELEGVHKAYPDGTRAVDGVSFAVPEGRVCVLIGPSGCGKTTLLRLVNKLLPLDRGTIRVAGRDITGEDGFRLRRRIGYAIQQVGLFPNMTIAENVAVVPSLEGWPRERIAPRVAELLALVGLLPEYSARYPHQLSGGEAQRVGVARALAADPPVLLMDEPFAALDPVMRERLQAEFLAIQGRLRKTVLLVSHDLDEALRMGDSLALMRAGRLEQFGTPGEILLRPATPFVREFLGGEHAFGRLARLPVSEALDPAWRAARSAGAPARQPHGPDTGSVFLDERGSARGWAPAPAGPVERALRPFPVQFAPETPVREALVALVRHDGQPGVVSAAGGRFLGVVTLRSIAALLAQAPAAENAPHPRAAQPGRAEKQ